MKKTLSIFIISFIIVFDIIFLTTNKLTFSENENRNLVEFPKFTIKELLNGKYIKQLETYLTDHFPLRDSFMGLKTKTQLLLGYKEINNVYIGEYEYLFEKYNTPTKTDQLLETLDNFQDKLDIELDLMLIPSSGLINTNYLPNYINFDNQEETLNHIKNNTTLNYIDILSAYQNNSRKELYYRLDHHYNIDGAYNAYLEFCKSKGFSPVENNSSIYSYFNGTLYSKTNIYNYTPDNLTVHKPDEMVYVDYVATNRQTNTLFEPEKLWTKDKYAYFLDGNHALITIDTYTDSKDEILIIKDSFANSFIPFLTSHYSKIHIIDLRMYNEAVSLYIEKNNIDDILFLYGIQGIDSDEGIYKLR